MKDFCLNFMKMVNKSCLEQLMIEKIAFEVDAKIRFGKKCINLQVSLFNDTDREEQRRSQSQSRNDG